MIPTPTRSDPRAPVPGSGPRHPWRFCALCALPLLVLSSNAHADSATDRLLARSLFEQGRELLAAQNYREACLKFAESQRLDPAGGTLLNLAACHEKEGKLASAWLEFQDAQAVARRDGRDDRVQAAQERLNAIAPLLSRLTIRFVAASPRPGVVVKLDGVVVPPAALGTAVPIDPGQHKIVATAPGRTPWEFTVDIGPSNDSKAIDVPELDDATPRPVASPSTEPAPEPASPMDSRRTVGLIAVGAGVVSLGVGAFFGFRAMSKWNDSKDRCGPGCDAEAASLADDARSAAWISNVGVGLGLIGVGIGSYLLLTPTKPNSRTARNKNQSPLSALPTIGTSGAGVSVSGRW